MIDLTIGTRTSELALIQADRIKNILLKSNKELNIGIKKIKTTGDKILDKSIPEIGGKGIFLKEIEKPLLQGKIDLAVHSLKDVPTALPEGLTIGAFLDEEDPRDCLVSIDHDDLMDLPKRGKVGTGSLRRRCQILRKRKDLEVVPIRGNVNTRLKKLETDDYDAIVLAVSGLKRLGLEDKITSYFTIDSFLPAVGQGTLAVEIREDNDGLKELLRSLEDPRLRQKMMAQRNLLKHLGGGCHVPVGCHSYISDGLLTLKALVGSPDGRQYIEKTSKKRPEEALELGKELADKLLKDGAGRFLDMGE